MKREDIAGVYRQLGEEVPGTEDVTLTVPPEDAALRTVDPAGANPIAAASRGE